VPSKLEAGSKAGSKRAAGVGGAVCRTNLWSESWWTAGLAVAEKGQRRLRRHKQGVGGRVVGG
jgi:hypothetical protein